MSILNKTLHKIGLAKPQQYDPKSYPGVRVPGPGQRAKVYLRTTNGKRGRAPLSLIPTEETTILRDKRNTRYKELTGNDVWPDCLSRHDQNIDPEHVETSGKFRDKVPKKLGHCLVAIVPGAGNYEIVSREYKEAIESLEPDVHQFFPFQMHTEDGRVFDDRFIFHHRADLGLDCIHMPASGARETRELDVDGEPHWAMPLNQPLDNDGYGQLLVFREEAIVGRHYWTATQPYMSGELAEILGPLQPAGITLSPMLTI